jgi:hypothetical protein
MDGVAVDFGDRDGGGGVVSVLPEIELVAPSTGFPLPNNGRLNTLPARKKL